MINHQIAVMTVVGTRPEIIRLSETIRALDEVARHILVHTGQNYDYGLNDVFFDDLRLRRPDYHLDSKSGTLGGSLAAILAGTEKIILEERPDAFLVLGDTNSAISAIIAKRMQIPVYHMEAGNRCYDENVPEEVNRRIVDHTADYNLVYTEHARRNLVREGIAPSRILLTGSPMYEVLAANREAIDASTVLSRLDLAPGEYIVASLHRQENVDNRLRLEAALTSIVMLSKHLGLPVLMSTHPRTRERLKLIRPQGVGGIAFHEPFGFIDYIALQRSARIVLSDSGTISEESSILGFPAITLRDSIERPEAVDTGHIVTSGVIPGSVLNAARIALHTAPSRLLPENYAINDTSRRVVTFIHSTAWNHAKRVGLNDRIED